MKPTPIRYSIRPGRPAAHRLEVRCTLTGTDPAGQRFALPAWIPGSYLIRDFARHIVAIRAETAGRPVRLATNSTSTPGWPLPWPATSR
jgi:predicted metalloprotease with PDZ domain